MTRWLATQKTDLYQQGTAKLVLRRGKCKDCVEKQWYISRSTVKCELFLLDLEKKDTYVQCQFIF